MHKTALFAGAFAILGAALALAQETTQEFDVQIRAQPGDAQAQRGNLGGSGYGECEIRVRIDQRANVEVRGARVRVRTLQGAPSFNQGSWCTGRIPDNPNDFRFQKGSGRGNSSLVQNPNPSNGGLARIYVEDSAGGADTYTFRLSWSGGSGGGGGGGGWGGGGGGWGGGGGGGGEWSGSGRGTMTFPGIQVDRAEVTSRNGRTEIRLQTAAGEFRFSGRAVRGNFEGLEVDISECGSGGRVGRCQGRAQILTNGREVRRIEVNGSTATGGRYTVNFQR